MSASVSVCRPSTATTQNLIIAHAQTYIQKILHEVMKAEITDLTKHGIQAART